jgi:hypothetical protein
MNAGSASVTPVGRTITSITVWPSVAIARSVTPTVGRSIATRDCAPTSASLASFGALSTIGLAPPAARASRNAWMLRSTRGLPAVPVAMTRPVSRAVAAIVETNRM